MKLILTLFFFWNLCFANPPKLIRFSCPEAFELTRTEISSSWARYRYTGTIYLDLPEENNTLHLFGDATAEHAHQFFGATWTDLTFLCLYDFTEDAIVLAEGQLEPHVKRCYFENSKYRTECNSTDPKACPITCELDMHD